MPHLLWHTRYWWTNCNFTLASTAVQPAHLSPDFAAAVPSCTYVCALALTRIPGPSFLFTNTYSHVSLSTCVYTCAYMSVHCSMHMSTHKSSGMAAGLYARLHSSLAHANPRVRCSTHMFYMHACCVTAVLVGARWLVPLRCCSACASVAEYTIVIVSLPAPASEEADGSATDTWMYVSGLL